MAAITVDVTPILDVPVIDLIACVSSESPVGIRQEELKKLRSALASSGCVHLMNHGMTSAFLDQVHEVGKHFFALPIEEKVKYSRAVGKMEGYGANSETQPHWADRMFLTVHPQDQRKLNLWPQNPQPFREILDEYTRNIKSLAESVLKAMVESLELPDNSFLKQYGEKASILAVFNFYPPCPTASSLNLGVMPHTDASAITILLQDNQVDGLQVLKVDQWFKIMSNGTFKSPTHKVMKCSERERMTIAMFCMPESDKEIGPVEELIREKTPRLYKTMANYTDLYRNPNEQGRSPIDEVKL